MLAEWVLTSWCAELEGFACSVCMDFCFIVSEWDKRVEEIIDWWGVLLQFYNSTTFSFFGNVKSEW